MLAVGYSEQSKAFIVRNSWGPEWVNLSLQRRDLLIIAFLRQGDKGYCYIPYAYMTNPQLCFDPWVVRQLEMDDIGHDNWDAGDATDYHPSDEEDGEDDDDDDDDGEFEEAEEEEEDAGGEESEEDAGSAGGEEDAGSVEGEDGDEE